METMIRAPLLSHALLAFCTMIVVAGCSTSISWWLIKGKRAETAHILLAQWVFFSQGAVVFLMMWVGIDVIKVAGIEFSKKTFLVSVTVVFPLIYSIFITIRTMYSSHKNTKRNILEGTMLATTFLSGLWDRIPD